MVAAGPDAVKEYIVTTFLPDVTADQLRSDYNLLANGAIDSLGLLKLIAWLEERFQISIDDVEIAPEDFRSVDSICKFIEKANSHQ